MLYQRTYPHGGDIYQSKIRLDFSVNTNPLGIPEGVLKAMQEALTQASAYPDPFCRELVKELSRVHQLPASYILCGNGAAELIYSYCLAIRPSRVLMPAPTFSEYEEGLTLLNRRVCKELQVNPDKESLINSVKTKNTSEQENALVGKGEQSVSVAINYYSLDSEQGFLLDDGFLEMMNQVRPEVIFLCSPNNPDGRLIPESLLQTILNHCHQHGIRVFLDECFLDLADPSRSMVRYLQAFPELCILKAFTKNYALAGVRLGYCLSADEALLSWMSLLTQPWNVSVIAQAAGVAALNEEEYLEKARALIGREREWLSAQLRSCGLSVVPSEANYLLFHGQEDLGAQLLSQGIAIRDCSNYHGLGCGWYRTAVRRHEENEELVRTLRDVR